MAEVRLGLIGCGRIAEVGYAPAAARARGVRLAAVADRVQERCATVAPGVPAFTGAPELIDARLVDALVIATPAAAHVEDAVAAAAAGLPALVEKPPAPSAREAARLTQLQPLPFVGFNRRFEPQLQELRAAAAQVPSLELQLMLQRRRGSWRSHEADDPVALDLGPHPVDLAFWLSGAEAARVSGEADAERLRLEVELSDGRGRATIECRLGPPYREVVSVRGLGTFRRGGILSALRARESPLVVSLARQLEAFARAARGEAEPLLATADDGLRVMETLERVTS